MTPSQLQSAVGRFGPRHVRSACRRKRSLLGLGTGSARGDRDDVRLFPAARRRGNCGGAPCGRRSRRAFRAAVAAFRGVSLPEPVKPLQTSETALMFELPEHDAPGVYYYAVRSDAD